jgi:hypothetical protein
LPRNPTVYRGCFFVRVITFIFMLVVGARSAVHLSKAPRHLASSQCLPGHKKRTILAHEGTLFIASVVGGANGATPFARVAMTLAILNFMARI